MTVSLVSKLKYRKGSAYKAQKSPAGNAGKSNKKKGNNTAARRGKEVVIPGNAVMLMDLSGVPKFCAQTGKPLPKRGMAWTYKDLVFTNAQAAVDYAAAA